MISQLFSRKYFVLEIVLEQCVIQWNIEWTVYLIAAVFTPVCAS